MGLYTSANGHVTGCLIHAHHLCPFNNAGYLVKYLGHHIYSAAQISALVLAFAAVHWLVSTSQPDPKLLAWVYYMLAELDPLNRGSKEGPLADKSCPINAEVQALATAGYFVALGQIHFLTKRNQAVAHGWVHRRIVAHLDIIFGDELCLATEWVAPGRAPEPHSKEDRRDR